MTDHPVGPDERRQELVDSLLLSLHQTSSDKAQTLVTQTLVRLADESQPQQRNVNRPPRRLSRPVAIAMAACALILVVGSLALFDRSGTAVAAVQKCLDQALVDVGRHYRVKWQLRISGDQQVKGRSDLYVQGGDRFVFRQQTPLANRALWFGSDRGQAWVVPPVGPVIEGGNQHLFEWATGQRDITGPYLHITAILQGMQSEYELQFVPTTGADVPSDLLDCQHVLGNRQGPRTNLAPDQVELWADSKTGLARRLEQRWQLPANGIGWESITIELIDETALPDNFFTADAHGGKNRTRISFEARE